MYSSPFLRDGSRLCHLFCIAGNTAHGSEANGFAGELGGEKRGVLVIGPEVPCYITENQVSTKREDSIL